VTVLAWMRAPAWMRTLPPQFVDGAIAAAFGVAMVVDKLHGPGHDPAHTLISGGLTLALTVSLYLRRRFPLTAFVAGAAAVAVESVLGVASAVSPYGGQVLVYSAGLYATRSRSWWVPPVVVVGVVVYFSGMPGTPSVEPVGVLFSWLATWAVGYTMARRREEQARARVAIRRQVVAEEQTRMARELHDLIGHTVNLLVVQAGAARVKLERDPATTRALLIGMEQTGRDALADLDHVLGLLRSDSGPDLAGAEPGSGPWRPGPGLAALPDLVSRLSDSQVQVTLSVELSADSGEHLARHLDLSAYRIVQEGLTNVLKHAAPCSAEVAIRRDIGRLVIDIRDDGRRAISRPGAGRGRGLIGVVERVSASGGTVEYGPRPAGGFAVHAVLPLS
jgi:signal transduction histidine kinase